MKRIVSSQQIGERYTTLRVGAYLFTMLGSVLLWVSGLQSVATGSFLRLMIHVEEYTRASAQMEKLWSRLEPSPEGVEPSFRA